MTTTHGHKALRSNRRTFRLLTFTFPFGERPVGSLERRAAARQDNRPATAMLLNQAVSAHPSCLEPLPRISIYFLAFVGQEAHLVTTNTSRLRFVPPPNWLWIGFRGRHLLAVSSTLRARTLTSDQRLTNQWTRGAGLGRWRGTLVYVGGQRETCRLLRQRQR